MRAVRQPKIDVVGWSRAMRARQCCPSRQLCARSKGRPVCLPAAVAVQVVQQQAKCRLLFAPLVSSACMIPCALFALENVPDIGD